MTIDALCCLLLIAGILLIGMLLIERLICATRDLLIARRRIRTALRQWYQREMKRVHTAPPTR